MKKLLVSLFLLGIAISFKSQNIEDFKMSNGIINDAKLVEHIMEKKYPGYKNIMNSRYESLAQQVNNIVEHQTGNRNLIQVPIVIHIVYKDSVENISQSDIEAQIDILNRDFQRNNADTSKLRNIFHPIAGNPNIQFLLRHVERVNTASNFIPSFTDLYDDIKHNSSGGSDAWPTTHYLNIWVGNLQGEFLLGYAYPPAGVSGWPSGSSAPTPAVDGIVIDYRAFGPTSFFRGDSLNGRTLVHEAGHYFGLRHIWGDGDCSDDDHLNDTPTAISESSGDCDTTKNTCNDGAGDMPDLVENYMDYSADTCMVTFTADQASLMRTALQTYRPDLIPTASLPEKYEAITFNLFPNPSNGVVNYDINVIGLDNLDINVMDLSGKVVHKENNVSIAGLIDLGSLKKGIYLVNVTSGSFVISERVSIQ